MTYKKQSPISYITQFLAVILLVIGYCFPVVAQERAETKSFRLELFDLPNNKLGNHVQTIAQDSFGFMWFGSQFGLHRWDGYNFKTYLHNPIDPNSISSSYVEHLIVARDGSIWVGTYGGGLNHFDPLTEIFTIYTYDENDPQSISNNFVSKLVEDKEGYIWLTTREGLNRFDPKAQTFKRFKHDPKDERSLSYDNCDELYIDSEGTLWVGAGWMWEEDNRGGLNRYHADTEDFTRYLHDPENPNSLSHDKVFEIKEDAKGNFWIGTAGDGLHLMDRATGTFTRLRRNQSGQISAPYLKDSYEWHTKFVFEDQDHQLWVGAWGGGIYHFDPESGDIQHFFKDHPMVDLPENSVWGMFQSSDGTLWGHTAGANARVFKIIEENHIFSYASISAENHALAIHQQENGDIWIASNMGLFHVDNKTGETSIYRRSAVTPDSINPYYPIEPIYASSFFLFSDIHRIESSGSDYIWLLRKYGKYNGLTRFRPGTGELKNYFYLPTLAVQDQICVHDVIKDEKGKIWVLTMDGSMHQYDAASETFITYPAPDDIAEKQADYRQTKLSLGNDDKLWIYGIYKEEEAFHPAIQMFDSQSKTFRYIAIKNKDDILSKGGLIYDLEEDKNGHLWIATERSLQTIDPKTGAIRVFDDGQLGVSNFRGIKIDDAGIIWLIGDALVAFDPKKESNLSFSADAGIRVLPSPLGAIYKSDNGDIFIGGKGGIQIFSPEDIDLEDFSEMAQVLITDLHIVGESYRVDGKPVFPNKAEKINTIKLQYDQDIFTFHFAGLNYLHPEANRHKYQLVGYDEDWRLAGVEPKATYIKIPPGKYTFNIQAANHQGAWGQTESVKLMILPPWWKTWWAYLLYVIIASSLVMVVYRFQLTRQVAKAEALRLKELDTAKTQLYTNITHEFRTPLTVILGMAAQVQDNPKAYFTSGMNMIVRNGENLLGLINQMLDLSKLESGKLSLKMMQGDIISYLKYLVESFHSLAENKSIQIHFLSDLESVMMDYDAEKVQQVISNLLSNAIKFTPVGGHIYCSVGKDEHDQLWIKVKDTGEGIAEEHLTHIFDRFYQIDDTSTRESSGSGIGLALTKELIGLMGGDIQVKSGVGKGTQFIVHLPITQNAAHVEEPITIADKVKSIVSTDSKMPATSIASGQNIADVLLIEDNPDVVRYLSSCLADQYRLHIAYDGQEGIELAKQLIPDLIISDVMMPKKDGFEVCQTLKNEELTSHIPIIMLTAKADLESKLEGLETGADVYLAKPFQKEELLVRARKLLESRAQLQRYYLQTASQSQPNVSMKDIPKVEAVENEFVQKVSQIVKDNMDNFDFTVEQFCKEVGMSNSQLHRKLSALTGYSATKFIRYIRLNHAKMLLQDPELTITAVAFDTGFNDPSYFGRVFKKEFGVTPMQWREETLSVAED
ncbi:MAG: two-component regulator propeller domain-containing protein [Bacteroidota bacterium]